MRKRGKLIVIDGIDKVGKATQTKLLVERLRREKKKVVSVSFPDYDRNFFGALIAECLQGKHGDFLRLDPKITSVLYAADRWETKPRIEKYLRQGFVVVSDRYVSANQIHQGGKIKNVAQRKNFLAWLDELEYGKFGLPRPDLTIHLTLPAALFGALLPPKRGGADIVERDVTYGRNSARAASALARKLNWSVIVCARKGAILTREEVHELVYEIVRAKLAG